MYNLKITYINGIKEEVKCQDYYYDDDVLLIELDDKHKTDIMIHQLRKIDALDLDDKHKE